MLLRIMILSALSVVLVCPMLHAESGGTELLVGIHNALDSGEMSPAQAGRRYRLIARRYRGETDIAAEALFSAGVAYEKIERFSDAADAYLAVISDYPDSAWFMPAVDALVEIGGRLLAGGSGGVFERRPESARRIFIALSDADIPLYQKAFARYKTGVCSLAAGHYVEAELDFKTVLEYHSVEPWLEKAYFKLGEAYAGRVRRPTRDQSLTKQAIAHFESFISKYPQSDLREDAEDYLFNLGAIKAEYLYGICGFYHRRGEKDAFEVYFGILSEKYPESPWTELAKEQFEF